MQFIQGKNFSDIADEFKQRVEDMVWCCAATVDTVGRPRTRVLHPIWDGHQGWIITYRDSVKSKHLATKPNMSLAYIRNPMQPVYADCTVEWVGIRLNAKKFGIISKQYLNHMDITLNRFLEQLTVSGSVSSNSHLGE